MNVFLHGVKNKIANLRCWPLPLPPDCHTSAILEVRRLGRGTKTTSIKPPLILIHFGVSREFPLIKCVPGGIMGVSWGHRHKANSQHGRRQTNRWPQVHQQSGPPAISPYLFNLIGAVLLVLACESLRSFVCLVQCHVLVLTSLLYRAGWL